MASPSASAASGGDWVGDEWTGVREALATVTSTEAVSEQETQEAVQLAAELEEVRTHMPERELQQLEIQLLQ